jgi:hypothetical protein
MVDTLLAPRAIPVTDHLCVGGVTHGVASSSRSSRLYVTEMWDPAAGEKLPLYAAAGVPEFWIVDLPEGKLEIYRRPEGFRYDDVRIVAIEDSVATLAFPEFSVSLAGLRG